MTPGDAFTSGWGLDTPSVLSLRAGGAAGSQQQPVSRMGSGSPPEFWHSSGATGLCAQDSLPDVCGPTGLQARVAHR